MPGHFLNHLFDLGMGASEVEVQEVGNVTQSRSQNMHLNDSSKPRVRIYGIGLVGFPRKLAAMTFANIGTVKAVDVALPIFGYVNNYGKADMVFSVQKSSAQGDPDTDAWATQQVRYAGSAVDSITLKPGAAVAFTIETVPELFLRFKATPKGSYGRLTLVHFRGELEDYNDLADNP